MARRNLVFNPRSRGAAGWNKTFFNATQIAYTPPDIGQEIPFYMKAQASADAGVGLVYTDLYTQIPVIPGKFYRGACDVFHVIAHPSSPGLMLVLIAWFDSIGTLLGQSLGPDQAVGTHDVEQTAILDKAPAGSAYCSLRVGGANAPNTQNMEFEASHFILEPLTTIAS